MFEQVEKQQGPTDDNVQRVPRSFFAYPDQHRQEVSSGVLG